MAVGGPNRGKPTSFFREWEVLEAEIKAYLADREAGPPAFPRSGAGLSSKEKKKAALENSNPLMSFFSTGSKPDRGEVDGYLDPSDWEGEPSALEYGELASYGYSYLVEPIMDAGGYAEVSAVMGLPVRARKQRVKIPSASVIKMIDGPERKTDGFLSLGSSLDTRLEEQASRIEAVSLSASVFAKQAALDSPDEAAPEAIRGESAILPLEQRVAARKIAEPKVDRGGGESLTLQPSQRVYMVLVALATALAYGKATSQAVERGILPSDIAELMHYLSLALWAGNLISSGVCAKLALDRRRNPLLWVTKAAFAGIPSLVELKGLGNLYEDEEEGG
jgi:hypothetical protein